MPLRPLFTGLRLLRVVLHLLLGVLRVALQFRFSNAPRRQRLKRDWSRQLLALLGIRIAASSEDLAGLGAGLLVANHISFIDVFVINAVLPAGFVAKSEVAQWPLIGWLALHNETVFIARGSRKAAHQTQQQMLQALASGRRLAIFPEGTTSAGLHLLPFHAALFQSAIDAAVPVHALTLSYHSADGSRSTAPAYIGELSLLDCLKNTVEADGLVARLTLAASFVPPLADRRHLAHRAHHAVATALARSHGTAPPSA